MKELLFIFLIISVTGIICMGIVSGVEQMDKKQSASQIILSKKHECNFTKCPYKGIKAEKWSNAVLKYTESDSFTDAWKIDMTHLQNPNWDYEKIDSVLFLKVKY